jgi:CBS domain-containing protein
MSTVAQILRTKGDQFYAIEPESPVFDALRLMAEKEVGALLVMKDDQLVGIVSERDYARKVALAGKSSPTTTVSEIMTPQVTTVRPEQTVDECMMVMTEGRFRHAPVVVNGKVAGVISLGDLVKMVISDQKYVIEQLEHYITS